MRRVLHYLVALILIALVPIPRADARGGGGGGGGFGVGFPGGFGGGFHGSPGVHAGNGFRRAVHRPGFVSHQRLPFVAHGFPRWRNGWGNWTGPVGGWWPGDAWTGGYYGYAYPPEQQAPASEPQIIVIREDGQGRMTMAEAPADFSYVKGCHAIPSGYHCDVPTATP